MGDFRYRSRELVPVGEKLLTLVGASRDEPRPDLQGIKGSIFLAGYDPVVTYIGPNIRIYERRTSLPAGVRIADEFLVRMLPSNGKTINVFIGDWPLLVDFLAWIGMGLNSLFLGQFEEERKPEAPLSAPASKAPIDGAVDLPSGVQVSEEAQVEIPSGALVEEASKGA